MYLKKVLLFTPIFLFLYGINSYNMHLSLFEDPFGQIASEEWVKESPIQFFIGYVLNLILKRKYRVLGVSCHNNLFKR